MGGARCTSAPARRPSSAGAEAAAAGKAAAGQPAGWSPLAVKGRAFRPSEDGGFYSRPPASPPAQPFAAGAPKEPHPGPHRGSSPSQRLDPRAAANAASRPPLAPIRTRVTQDSQPQLAPAQARQQRERDQRRGSGGGSGSRTPAFRENGGTDAGGARGKPSVSTKPRRPFSVGPYPQQQRHMQAPRFLPAPLPYHQRLRGLLDGQVGPIAPVASRQPSRGAAFTPPPAGLPSHPSQQDLRLQQQQQAGKLAAAAAAAAGDVVPVVQGRSMDLVPQAAGGRQRAGSVPQAVAEGCGEEEYWEWLFKEQQPPGSPYGSDVLRALLSAVSPKFAVPRPEGYVPLTPSDISSSRYVRSDIWTGNSGPSSPGTVILAAPAASNAIAAALDALPVADSPRYPPGDWLYHHQQLLLRQSGASVAGAPLAAAHVEEFWEGCPEEPDCGGGSPERQQRQRRQLGRRAAAAVASILNGGEAVTFSRCTSAVRQSGGGGQVAPLHRARSRSSGGRVSGGVERETEAEEGDAAFGAARSGDQQQRPQQQPQQAHWPGHRCSSATAQEGLAGQPLWMRFPPELWKELAAAAAAEAVAAAGGADQPSSRRLARTESGGAERDGPSWGSWEAATHRSGSRGERQQQQAPPTALSGKSRFFKQQQQQQQQEVRHREQEEAMHGVVAPHASVSSLSSESSAGTIAIPEPFERQPSCQRQYSRQSSQRSRAASRQQSPFSRRSSALEDRSPPQQQQQGEGAHGPTGCSDGSSSAVGSGSSGSGGGGGPLFRRTPSKAWQQLEGLVEQLELEECGSYLDRPTGRHPMPMRQPQQEQLPPRGRSPDRRSAQPPHHQVQLLSDASAGGSPSRPVACRCGRCGADAEGRGGSPDEDGCAAPVGCCGSCWNNNINNRGRSPGAAALVPPLSVLYNGGAGAGAGAGRFRTPERSRTASGAPTPPLPPRAVLLRTPTASGSCGGLTGGVGVGGGCGLSSGGGSGFGSSRGGGGSPGGFRGPSHCLPLRARSAGRERLSPSPLRLPLPQRQSPGSPATPSSAASTSSCRRTPPAVVPLTWEPPPPPPPPVPLVVLLSPHQAHHPHPHSTLRSSGSGSHDGSSGGSCTPSCPASPCGGGGGGGGGKDTNSDLLTTAAIGALLALSPRRDEPAPAGVGGAPRPCKAAATQVMGSWGAAVAAAATNIPGAEVGPATREQLPPPRPSKPQPRQHQGAQAPAEAEADVLGACQQPQVRAVAGGVTEAHVTSATRAERLHGYCDVLDVTSPQEQKPRPKHWPSSVRNVGPAPSPSGRKSGLPAAAAASGAAARSPSGILKPLVSPASSASRLKAFASPSAAARSPTGVQQRKPLASPLSSPSAAAAPILWSSSARRKALGSPSTGAVGAARRRWTVTVDGGAVSVGAGASALGVPGESSSLAPRPATRPLPPPSATHDGCASGSAAAPPAAASSRVCRRSNSGRKANGEGLGGAAAAGAARRTETSAVPDLGGAAAAAAASGDAAAAASSFLTPRLAAALAPAATRGNGGSSSSSTGSGSDCGSRVAPTSSAATVTSYSCSCSTAVTAAPASSVDSWSTASASVVSATLAAAAAASSVTAFCASSAAAPCGSAAAAVCRERVGGSSTGREVRSRYDGIPRAVAAPTSDRVAAAAPKPATVSADAADGGVKEDDVRRNLLSSFGDDRSRSWGSAAGAPSCSSSHSGSGPAPGGRGSSGAAGLSGHVRRSHSSPAVSPRAATGTRADRPSPLSRPSAADPVSPAPSGGVSPTTVTALYPQPTKPGQPNPNQLPPRPRRRQWELQSQQQQQQQPAQLLQQQARQAALAIAAVRRTGEEGGGGTVPLAAKPPLAPPLSQPLEGPAGAAMLPRRRSSMCKEAEPAESAPPAGIAFPRRASADGDGGGRRDGACGRPASATSLCAEDSSQSHPQHHWSYQRNRERARLISGAFAAAAAAGGAAEPVAASGTAVR